MVITRRSLGTPSSPTNPPRKRRSLEDSSLPFKKLYPDLLETTSYASTTYTRTSEIADDEEEYETEHDSSFDTSRASVAPEIKNQKATDDWWKYGLAATIVVVVIVAICIGMSMEGKNKPTDSHYEAYIKSVRSSILPQFPDVSQENRAILRLIGQKVYLEPENTAPLVILVGGTQGRRFAEAVSEIIRSTTLENSPGKLENPVRHESIRVESETNRAELHEILKSALTSPATSSSTNSPKTAVVLDVDLLKWDAVLVLHAFADHEKYPVPKTVLFLTVSSENESSADGSCDEQMVGFLTRRWIENGGSVDNIPPIIARISYFLCV